jgi:oligopeptide transport system substrate-binding protein
MKKTRKLVLALLAMAMTTSVLAGCKKTPEVKTSTEPAKTETVKKNTFAGPKVLRLSGMPDEGLNNHTNSSAETSTLISYIYGALLDLTATKDGKNIQFVPYHAKELPTSTDSKVWTFKIREGLKFTDGTPINAKTYEYSWKMLLDQKLANYGARVLFDSIPVLNAKNYFQGKAKWEEVGIKAKDDYTLEVTLETAMPKIDVLVGFSGGGSLSPVHEKLYEAGMKPDRSGTTYATTLETVPSSGTYKITSWVKDQSRTFEKNKDDIMASVYMPDKIESRVVTEAATRLQLFENKDIDSVSISGTNYDKYADDPRVVKGIANTVWGYYINSASEKNPILKNQDFRKALYYGMPREPIAKGIFKTFLPAGFFVSTACFVGDPSNGGQRYRDTEQAKALVKGDGTDTALAKQYFDKAYAANGNTKITITVTYFDAQDTMKRTAEVTQEELQKLFGADKLEVKLRAIPANAAYQSYYDGDFDLGIGARTQNTFNPWSSMTVYTSTFPQKADRFYNKDFDDLQTRTTKGDLMLKDKERVDALLQMEKMLVDYVPFVPLFQNNNAIMYSAKLDLLTDGTFLPAVGFAIMQADHTADR